jgi:hypothetical protein
VAVLLELLAGWLEVLLAVWSDVLARVVELEAVAELELGLLLDSVELGPQSEHGSGSQLTPSPV